MEPSASRLDFFETYEISEINEKTDTKISNLKNPIQKSRENFQIHFTKSFKPNVNTWENIIYSKPQREVNLMKNVKNKSCR